MAGVGTSDGASTSCHSVNWYHPDGHQLTDQDWHAPMGQAFAMDIGMLACGGERWYVLFNASDYDIQFRLPPPGEGLEWIQTIDTATNDGLPFLPDDPRIVDSTGALELRQQPKKMLVVGGGIIGLEMACVYSALGSEVTVVEFMDQLMPGADKDLVKPLADLLKKRGVAVHLGCKVTEVTAKKDGLHASFEGDSKPERREHHQQSLRPPDHRAGWRHPLCLQRSGWNAGPSDLLQRWVEPVGHRCHGRHKPELRHPRTQQFPAAGAVSWRGVQRGLVRPAFRRRRLGDSAAAHTR